MVVALIALFVSFGGVSYGLATGSINSREIKNNSIRSKDVRDNAIRGLDVRNGSLSAADFTAGQLPAGPAGPAGPQGTFGSVVLRTVQNYNGQGGVVDCEPGEYAVGGGAFDVQPFTIGIRLSTPLPSFDPGADPSRPTRWHVSFTARPDSADLYAVCVK